MVFDKTARQRSEAARLALREDPRQLMRLPLTASAGLSVPITQHAQIGVEYSFSEAGRTSPFQFRPGGRPADELAGHSATFRVGLNL
jgi:opacity protein-like surface antigen